MTSLDIEELHLKKAALKARRVLLELELQATSREMLELNSACDHKFHDGSLAKSEGDRSLCSICGCGGYFEY